MITKIKTISDTLVSEKLFFTEADRKYRKENEKLR